MFANPVASNADLPRLRAALDEHLGLGTYGFVPTPAEPQNERMESMLVGAIRQGCDLAIAAGGDGTVSWLSERLRACGAIASDVVLGIVPMGTSNVLARELDIPIPIEQAVALAAARPRVVALDGIACGQRLFLTQVGIGLDAYMIRDTARESQQRFKRFSYLAALIRRIAGHGSQPFEIVIDGRRVRVRAWQVLVANAATLGAKPFVWGPDIDPSDGTLDVCLFQVRRRRDLVALGWSVLTGRHEASPHTRFLHARHEIVVRSPRPSPVQGDGEPLGNTPITLALAPAAVSVVVPEASEAPEGEGEAPSAAESPAVQNPDRCIECERLSSAGSGPAGESVEPRSAWVRLQARLAAADTAGYLAINRLNGGPLVDRALIWASRLLDHGELYVAISIVAALIDRSRFGHVPLAVVPPLWLAMLTVNFPIKSTFRRRRPFLLHTCARLVCPRPADTSFPSGHTAAAFAGAMLLTPHLPALAPGLWAYAFVVAFSRIYLGVHFPADVLVGGGVGIALALLASALWRLVVPGL